MNKRILAKIAAAGILVLFVTACPMELPNEGDGGGGGGGGYGPPPPPPGQVSFTAGPHGAIRFNHAHPVVLTVYFDLATRTVTRIYYDREAYPNTGLNTGGSGNNIGGFDGWRNNVRPNATASNITAVMGAGLTQAQIETLTARGVVGNWAVGQHGPNPTYYVPWVAGTNAAGTTNITPAGYPGMIELIVGMSAATLAAQHANMNHNWMNEGVTAAAVNDPLNTIRGNLGIDAITQATQTQNSFIAAVVLAAHAFVTAHP